ncbi:L,D-transpeptidase family protein [Daejeonella sp.]|uniref:L,D-transpeptidase family protein n=1 Tax=Daejeonella sp. TaxID=2805397 RepID=UPI0039835D95
MKTLYVKILIWIALSLFVQPGCGQTVDTQAVTDANDGNKDQTVSGNFSSQTTQVFDSLEVSRFFVGHPNLKEYEKDVRSFYQERKFAYAWFEKGLLIEPAHNLSNRILNLENEGIYRKLFYKEALDSLMHGTSAASKSAKPDVMLEILLTAEYFVYSKLAWDGMSKEVSKSNKWFLPRKAINYNTYLDSLLNSPAKGEQIKEPVYRQYELLRGYLVKYRKLDSGNSWEPLVSRKMFALGDSSAFIRQIKSRLFLLGDFAGDTSDQTFDKLLADALIIFQQRNGLTQDGTLGKETMAAINVPLKSRIRQIIVNMERSRWLPVQLAGDYVAVNIPEFKLHVYSGENLLWSCNAVVGKTVHPTSLFYGEIKYVVFSPYWNIPPGILRNEIIPGMKKNSNYLAKHNMEITGYKDGLPIVRQKPGPSNSLGLVKFVFPNSYNIYLHDTPSKSLFNQTSRAFSHGCIRIAEPAKFAGFLLRDAEGWDGEKISQAMHAGKERFVTLNKKVPVFISYFTAFIDRDNRMNFRKDIYDLDERLASMIISGEGAY